MEHGPRSLGGEPPGGQGALSRGLRLVAPPGLALLFAAPYVRFASGGDERWLYLAVDAAVVLGFVVYGLRANGRKAAATFDFLGLLPPRREIGVALLFALGLAGAAWLLLGQLRSEEIVFVEYVGGWRQRAFSVSQVLHQELFARGLLLAWLLRCGTPGWAANIGLAAVFVVAHSVFYGLSVGEWLPVTTLVTLACFTVAANHLYVQRAHIALGLGLHAGWNVVRFGGAYATPAGWIAEGESFVWIEGAPEAAVGALVVAGLVVWLTPARASRQAGEADIPG